MAPVRSKSDEMNSNVPKSLCKLTNHLSCVNCVRWSLDGRWLASGGDDAIVMIWQIKRQGMVGSGFGATTHEHWGCVHMLRGHSSDILDLSWSPDRKYLASCSVDNSIVIWNVRDLPQKTAVISGHSGMVKGITWDPVGKFVASQSDDRSVKIWRTSDWREVKNITKPFERCGGTTHVLRLSWSPDGKYIVSAHALNNDGPTAQIIERGVEWKTGMDFVGHRKAVEVVLFNPHLFVNSGSKDNHGCVALGSRDRSLSVWLTNLKRPLLVMHDLFNDSILDLSWSHDGYELLVSSTDGTVAYICFSDKELGLRLSKQALDDLYMRTYGFKREKVIADDTSMVLIENPEMLKIHSSQEKASLNKSSFLGNGSGNILDQSSTGMVSGSSKTSSITKQLETRTKDGKRRITPITLTSEPSSMSGAPLPFTSFSPKQNKGAVVQTTPEKMLTSKRNTSSSEHSTPKSAVDLSSDATPPKPISFEPLSPQKIQDPLTTPVPNVSSSAVKTITMSPKTAGTSSPKAGQKRDADKVNDVLLLPKAKLKKRGAHVTAGVSVTHSTPKPSTPQRHSTLQSVLKQGSLPQLPVPKLESNLNILLLNVDGSEDAPMIEVDNDMNTSRYSLSYVKRSEMVWKVSLSSPCVIAAANEHVTCINCRDKSLSIYSTQTGRLLLGRLILQEACYDLKVESHSVMAVLCCGMLSVWNTKTMKSLLRDVSFAQFLRGSKTGPDACLLTQQGLPVIRIGGNSFIFNSDMQSWMELVSSVEISEIQNQKYNFVSQSQQPIASSLDSLQKPFQATRKDSVGLMLQHIRSSGSQSSTLAYLEGQISRSFCLMSPLEYKHWCLTYVKYLVKDNLEGKLREFCRIFSFPAGKTEIVLGFNKLDLLQEFLVIIAKNTKLQRLYSELKEIIDMQQRHNNSYNSDMQLV